VAALDLSLCNCDGTIEHTNLLNRCNGCTWSAPRFQQSRHILIVGDRHEKFVHAPQWVWRIRERIAADPLDARGNLRAPFGSKSGCDRGEDAELRSKLQGTRRVLGGEDPLNLCTNSFTREARSEWSIASDRCGGSWLHRQIEARNKTNRAQHAQRIFKEAFGRISNGAQQTMGQIIDATVWIDDGAISNWVGSATRLGGETIGDRVDREVSTREVALNTREESDLIGATGVAAATVSAEGGDFANHSLVGGHADGAKPILIGGVCKECTQLIWRRFGGEVPIRWRSSSDHIANGTAHNICAKSCRSQRAQQVSNVARDGGANRRRGGHAPLAAALSEIKRKSRHAE